LDFKVEDELDTTHNFIIKALHFSLLFVLSLIRLFFW